MTRCLLALLVVACQPKTAPLALSTPPEPIAAPSPVAPAQPVAAPVSIQPSNIDGRCEPGVAPIERRAGDLVIHAPPDAPREAHFLGRLRTHTEGSLAVGNVRTWVGPHVPGFVPVAIDTAELFLLERDGEDWIALYREPYGDGYCGSSMDAICRYVVKGFRECEPTFTLELRELMSRRNYLEVHDLHVKDGILYFNEACQSYAKEVGGKCSSIVAVDTKTGKVAWRSNTLVSNNRFLVLDRYIISGYGFTDEPDALFVLRRDDGKLVQKVKLRKSHENLVIEGDLLTVKMYEGTRRFKVVGFDGDEPKLVAQ